VLGAVTVLETAGRNTVHASQALLACEAGGHDDEFAPLIKIPLRLGNGIRLRLLDSIGPELKEHLDDIGSPVLRLLPTLLHRVGAGELVAEPRSQ